MFVSYLWQQDNIISQSKSTYFDYFVVMSCSLSVEEVLCLYIKIGKHVQYKNVYSLRQKVIDTSEVRVNNQLSFERFPSNCLFLMIISRKYSNNLEIN